MAEFDYSNCIRLSSQILIREVEGEIILLNLDNASYYALNSVGSRMLQLLTSSPSIQQAYEALLDEYEVEPLNLKNDLSALIDQLNEHGMLVRS